MNKLNPWASTHTSAATGNPLVTIQQGGLTEIGIIRDSDGLRLQISGPAGLVEVGLDYPQVVTLMRGLFGVVEDLARGRLSKGKAYGTGAG